MIIRNLDELIESVQKIKAEHGNLPTVTLDPLYLTPEPLYLRLDMGQQGKYLIVGDMEN